MQRYNFFLRKKEFREKKEIFKENLPSSEPHRDRHAVSLLEYIENPLRSSQTAGGIKQKLFTLIIRIEILIILFSVEDVHQGDDVGGISLSVLVHVARILVDVLCPAHDDIFKQFEVGKINLFIAVDIALAGIAILFSRADTHYLPAFICGYIYLCCGNNVIREAAFIAGPKYAIVHSRQAVNQRFHVLTVNLVA